MLHFRGMLNFAYFSLRDALLFEQINYKMSKSKQSFNFSTKIIPLVILFKLNTLSLSNIKINNI